MEKEEGETERKERRCSKRKIRWRKEMREKEVG